MNHESLAVEARGSMQQSEAPTTPRGPSRPDAPLPPRGPFAPGEQDTDARENRSQNPVARPIESDEKRPLPSYDGTDDATTVGDVALWVPRIVLLPLYLVSEYIVRRPLGFVATTAERNHWPAILVDFFTFGPEQQAGVVPTGIIDFGFRPSIGLYFFWNDAFADGNDIRLRGATGGRDWWWLRFIDRYEFIVNHDASVRGELSIRPDHIFNGFGPESPDADIRFQMTRLEARLGYDADLWRSSALQARAGFVDATFDPETGCCGDTTLAQAIAEDFLPEPPGLEGGYSVLQQELSAVLDTRPERMLSGLRPGVDWLSPPGTGVKLGARVEHAVGVGARAAPPGTSDRYQWITYGASLGVFFDPTEHQRVLGLEVVADFVDPLGDAAVPFTEQVSLGGTRPMRGFLEGRLVDRSAAVARFTYQWPVWVWFDGILSYAVGNVFGEHLRGFELDLLRSSFGIGVRAADERDHAFELLLGAGTKTFRDGGAPDELRFVIGASSGF